MKTKGVTTLSEKPILFNTEMVRAILDGRKTQTRRVVVPHYRDGDAGFNVITNAATGKFLYIEYYDEDESSTERRLNPPYMPGDILYVRETWAAMNTTPGGHFRPHPVYYYKADDPDIRPISWDRDAGKWRPSIHMPKAAARIFLKVKDVRAERVQDITEEAARAEGCPSEYSLNPRGWFRSIWDRVSNDNTNWDANPWVWVYEFERIQR